MPKLHVTSLPPALTSANLRVLFEQIGPVRHAKIVKDRDGRCIMGVVEMSFAEDVEEILTTKDRISIGGRRPHIWKATDRKIGELIKAEYSGVYLKRCQGCWYLFEVREGHLQWCWRRTRREALTCYSHYLGQSKA
jgi:hypothetical protein